ncbi:MAG: 16S rRNA (guanine(966)-N(2))-methyltransferase RsmD [Bdellovibrionales bacterium]|nr:16S rRNA (guanine(966)-N(2))-methyltransferase RsmD [Bdellovibrionales bacterium]
MKITAGQFKGHRLCSFSADFIRPMTSRVKSSVFNTLYSYGWDPSESRVLDLFSGTGNLALETLSRGARDVHLVESHKKALQIIKKNCRILKNPRGIKIHNKNVFSFLSSYRGESFDLIFADPPFQKRWGGRILEALILSKTAGEHSLLVLEISSQESIPEESGSHRLKICKKFGDKRVLFYTSLV